MDRIKFSVKTNEKGEIDNYSFSPVNCSTEETEFVSCLGGILFQNKIRILSKKEAFETLRRDPANEELLIESSGVEYSGITSGKGKFILETEGDTAKLFANFIANFQRLSRHKKINPELNRAWGGTFTAHVKN